MSTEPLRRRALAKKIVDGVLAISDDSRSASTLIAELRFASVVHGVSDAAVKQGCEVED